MPPEIRKGDKEPEDRGDGDESRDSEEPVFSVPGLHVLSERACPVSTCRMSCLHLSKVAGPAGGEMRPRSLYDLGRRREMPIHDWTRADAGDFHHFHQRWISALTDDLTVVVCLRDSWPWRSKSPVALSPMW